MIFSLTVSGWICGAARWVNAVGMSNPGLGTLLETGKWQSRTKPFLISVASSANSRDDRIREFRVMAEQLRIFRKHFSAPFGVQVNLSCPNTEHGNLIELVGESIGILSVMETIGVPIVLKYSIVSAPIEAILYLNDHPGCDAICISNTVPFGAVHGRP